MTKTERWITLLLVALIIVGFNGLLYQRRLTIVPEAMGVWRITYSNQHFWGFVPSANETGIVIFAMPSGMSEALAQGGISWLDSLPRERNRRARYTKWYSTPASTDLEWATKEACRGDRHLNHTCPGIVSLLGSNGSSISYETEIDDLINDAIFAPGAYYSFGRRNSILIVIPDRKRIAYVYSN